MTDTLSELQNCTLCAWECGVDRLAGERGVCGIGRPTVAATTLHPAPPQSYTVFLAGCNLRCLNCQNWELAHYPETEYSPRGYVDPGRLAEEAYSAVKSPRGQSIGADRIFFSGGSPTPSLPYVESVVSDVHARGDLKVNFDTNGFLTPESLRRVIDISDSITFDIKAYHDDVHRALTGAPVNPVLENAWYVAEHGSDQLWEFRVLLVPEISANEIELLAKFVFDIDPTLPVNFLPFRPHFVLGNHTDATREMMERAVDIARDVGLENVRASGGARSGTSISARNDAYSHEGGRMAGGRAREIGCATHPRNCGGCASQDDCPIKPYTPN